MMFLTIFIAFRFSQLEMMISFFEEVADLDVIGFADGVYERQSQSSTRTARGFPVEPAEDKSGAERSEEHTSELQSRQYLVCRLLLEKNSPAFTATGMTAAPHSGSSTATMTLVSEATAWLDSSLPPTRMTKVRPDDIKNSVMVREPST